MNAHVVLIGPHGAGKSSLAHALVDTEDGKFSYEIDKIVTSRQQRPNEGDWEYEFVSHAEFDARRPEFLYVQENRGVDWYYALREQSELGEKTIRLHVVLPETARFLKQQSPDDTIVVAILPPDIADMRERMLERDPSITKDELELRLRMTTKDTRDSKELADIVFYNRNDLVTSAAELKEQIEQYLQERKS